LTAPVGYVRLHGRNCFNWFGAAEHPSRAPRYDYLYSEDELAEWVRRIDQIRSYSERTFVVANNGTNGKAITNALQLQALLQGRIPLVPKELSRACRRGAASQKALFTEYNSRAVA
ncbi:MAG TPA: DUF72 domain-containing protein, partial [Bryobacteraceae bacterium]|nr:DUF72 domain-containing protein [Bryobacteraceae bacterium]